MKYATAPYFRLLLLLNVYRGYFKLLQCCYLLGGEEFPVDKAQCTRNLESSTMPLPELQTRIITKDGGGGLKRVLKIRCKRTSL